MFGLGWWLNSNSSDNVHESPIEDAPISYGAIGAGLGAGAILGAGITKLCSGSSASSEDSNDTVSSVTSRSLRCGANSSWFSNMWKAHPILVCLVTMLFVAGILLLAWYLWRWYAEPDQSKIRILAPEFDIENPREIVRKPAKSAPPKLRVTRMHHKFPKQVVAQGAIEVQLDNTAKLAESSQKSLKYEAFKRFNRLKKSRLSASMSKRKSSAPRLGLAKLVDSNHTDVSFTLYKGILSKSKKESVTPENPSKMVPAGKLGTDFKSANSVSTCGSEDRRSTMETLFLET